MLFSIILFGCKGELLSCLISMGIETFNECAI